MSKMLLHLQWPQLLIVNSHTTHCLFKVVGHAHAELHSIFLKAQLLTDLLPAVSQALQCRQGPVAQAGLLHVFVIGRSRRLASLRRLMLSGTPAQ